MQNERENLVHSFELPGVVCVFYLHILVEKKKDPSL